MIAAYAPRHAQSAILVNPSSFPVTTPFIVESGDSLKSIEVTGNSEITVTGGSIVNVEELLSRPPIWLLDHSQADISGGLLQVRTRSGVTFGTAVLEVIQDARLNVSGGLFEALGSLDQALVTNNRTKIHISGGTFIARDRVVQLLPLADDAELTISGGHFVATSPTGVELSIRAGTVNVLARSAMLDGAPVDFGPLSSPGGVLAVVYPNGTQEEIVFSNSGAINLIQVPEPVLVTPSTVVAMLLATIRRRRAVPECHP